MFGSILSDNYVPGKSDIDLLIEFFPRNYPSLFQFAGLEIALTEIFHNKVDLKTKEDLSRFFRDEVVNSSVSIYESESDFEYV